MGLDGHRVKLISIFRNSISYVDRYVEQVNAFRWSLDDPDSLEVVVAEGDSDDGTFTFLDNCDEIDRVLKIDHGGPRFNSVDNPQRWGQIAFVYNALLDELDPDGPVILVESDLIWQPQTMLGLLKHLGVGIDAVAPLSVKGDRFYDTWGHRWPDGTCFTSNLDQIVTDGKLLRPLASAGSCIVMKEEVARKARFGAEDGIVGFCNDMHRLGFTLYLDDREQVRHP